MKRRAASCFKGRASFVYAAASRAGAAPTPKGRGAKPKRTWRRTQIHANSRQELPIAVLSLFKGLAGLARGAQPGRSVAPRAGRLRGPSEILPKASIERPGASEGLQNPFHFLQKISVLFPESGIINGLRANEGKKIGDPAVGRTGSRAAEARARPPGQSPIPLSPSIPILAFHNRDFLPRGLQSPSRGDGRTAAVSRIAIHAGMACGIAGLRRDGSFGCAQRRRGGASVFSRSRRSATTARISFRVWNRSGVAVSGPRPRCAP
jgi:hypothetical protein